MEIARKTRVLEGCSPDELPIEQLLSANEPVVLKGLVKDWDLVKAGRRSDEEAMQYLQSFYKGRPVQFSHGEPEIAGRPFYNADFTALNCVVRRAGLDQVLAEIREHLADERPPTHYVASLTVDTHLPGFRQGNDVNFAAHGLDPIPSIWIGNRTVASCHYDAPSNLACCAVGKRRFTTFPPEQIFNLYPGPLEPTPGGQAVSLVEFAQPDFERYPRFREAIAAGQIAELEPGDAIFIPSMWWHHVEGLSPFNTLVNYWWSMSPKFIP
ncbi:MAG TPA: cupin-like domain-containing protein, partial [Povalibacter sp.]|nr:cupin-like domain-containing protein [Povalibacter sp.]